jgi:hypothetical protein
MKITKIEKGCILGFLVGLYFLGMSWFFKYKFDLKFCFNSICIRWISLLPFLFAILGVLFAFLIKIHKD